jgi:hypothetical protein
MRAPRGRGNARLQRIILAGIDLTLEVDHRTKKLSGWHVLKRRLRTQASPLEMIAAIMFQSAGRDHCDEEHPIEAPMDIDFGAQLDSLSSSIPGEAITERQFPTVVIDEHIPLSEFHDLTHLYPEQSRCWGDASHDDDLNFQQN